MSFAGDHAGGSYLQAYLTPFETFLQRSDVTDIFVNGCGELWCETLGGKVERHDAPALNEATLTRFVRQVAAYNHQGISREHPLLSASLPDGSRIQVVAPPATRGNIALAIRKHISSAMTLDDFATQGAFRQTRTDGTHASTVAELVKAQIDLGDVRGALHTAVRGRLNILISGGTSTGKTTFLNALIDEIPAAERLIYIEDTPELRLGHANALGLIAARNGLGDATVSANDLVSASLRLRPDRIILGELRGREAFSFLRAINTGHPGSMTTIHANSARGALEQLALLVLESGTTLSRSEVIHYTEATIGLSIQLTRDQTGRHVSECLVRA